MDKSLHKIILRSFLLFLSLHSAQALELQCKFSEANCFDYETSSWNPCFGCIITNIHLSNPHIELTVNSRDSSKTIEEVLRVEISSSTLKFVPNKLIELFPSMTHLYLQDNEGLTQLKPEYFENMKDLLQLWFWNNELQQIEGNMFKHTPNLKVLGVQTNKITDLDKDSFKGLNELETLFVHSNLFESLHKDTFKDNKKLKWLHISHGKLINIPYGVFSHLSLLTKLDLQSNPCINEQFTSVDTNLEQILMDQCGKNQDIMNKKDKELNSALIDGKQSKTQLLKCKNEYINLEQHCKTQKSKFEVFEQKYCKKYAFEKRSGFQEVNDAIIFN